MLNYTERMAYLTNATNQFLRGWKPPSHLDDAGKMERIKDTADAINSLTPTSYGHESLNDRCEAIFSAVKRSYGGKEWPSVAFVYDTAKAIKPDSGESTPVSSAAWDNGEIDDDAMAAKRIRAGEPVGDSYIVGAGAVRLISSHEITEDDLVPYRKSLWHSIKTGWGEEIAQARMDDMRSRMFAYEGEMHDQ